MKKTSYILLVSCAILCFSACRTEIDFSSGTEVEKMVVESVITPVENGNHTKLSTSVVINSELQHFDQPEDAHLLITNTDSQESTALRFMNEGNQKCYGADNITIEEGETYKLDISLVDSDILDVDATTTVPFKTEIQGAEFIIDTIFNADDPTMYGLSFECSIVLDDPVSFPAFYNLIPLMEDYGIDVNGDTYLRSDDISYFDNFDYTIGGNASHDLEHRNGMLINQSKLVGNNLVFSFQTEDTLVEGQDVVPSVTFKLRTVHEDFYYYFLSTSKQIRAVNSGSSQPVINYSNINNGVGVFSSYSESEKTFSTN